MEFAEDRDRREKYNHKLVHDAVLISVGTWFLVLVLLCLGFWLTMLAIRKCREIRAAKVNKKKSLNDEQKNQIQDIQNILGALDARLAQFEE